MSKKRIDHDGARVYEMLNPKPKELLQKRRTLVRQGEIVMWSNNEKILKKRYLFLFEDVLLITKKEFTNNYWLKIFITLKPSIKAGLFKNSKYKIPNVEFRIYCATTTFALFGKNKEEAETWVRDINKGCGHDQKQEEPKETPKKEVSKEVSKEEYNDIQKYNKTGEQKNVQTKLNIDESLIPNQFFATESENPPSYQETVQQPPPYQQQPPQQHPSLNTINLFQQQPPQQQPVQQQPIQQQPFLFTGNTNLFGNFPVQQQPIQQQPIQQQPIQQPIQQQPIQQPNQDIQLNLFLPPQQQPIQQPQQQVPSIVAFEQNGLKIVFDFPPKENGIILLTMRSGNANNTPITHYSLKMAAPSYVDLKMAVATGDVLGPNNSLLVEQRVKLLNTLQGIKPLILKLKIEGLYGNETIDIIHTVSNLPDL